MFSDGFLVDGVHFRSFENPDNVAYLGSIRSGEVPLELEGRVRDSGGVMNTELIEVDRNFDSVADMAKHVGVETADSPTEENNLFHGIGSVLSSPSTNLEPSRNFTADLGYPESDMSKPTTSIQIRFPSGTRSVRTFNTDMPGTTVLQLIANSTGLSSNNIGIISGFPPRQIPHSDLASKSISELGLTNSAVSVVFK